MILHIDIETYSSIDIRTSGAYKYCESVDFEILMVAYAFDDQKIRMVDMAQGEKLPYDFVKALLDPAVKKHAHNANFERNAFRAIGYDVPIDQWHCSAVKSAYCGLPLSLEAVSEALKLGDKGKLSTGKQLIQYFSIPCKPTKTNGLRNRNFPHHDIEKWEQFKEYCINDVEAEREIGKRLDRYDIPAFERRNYILDQKINDRGIMVDVEMANNAVSIDSINTDVHMDRLKELTDLDNPNSPAQLRKWLSTVMHKEIKSLAKEPLEELIKEAEAGYWVNEEGVEVQIDRAEIVLEVLRLRQQTGKSSTKKYDAMMNCVCYDGRVHGLFQFYGASRTGRWAGRLVQLQNLPQNKMSDDTLDEARKLTRVGDYESLSMTFANVADTLSQLIRTAFIAKPGHTFAVADFSAIEARVIAWYANEIWRLDVFNTHGKIYEASASKMFNVPIEEITKGSDYRGKGKIAELALGFGGSVGALAKMGGEKMGLSHEEMAEIVQVWRGENKRIAAFWKAVNNATIEAIENPNKSVTLKLFRNLEFLFDGNSLTIKLPSGRKLFYNSATLTTNRFGSTSVKYKGTDPITKKWWWIESYGGKFVENIVQATARDILADSIQRLDRYCFNIVMHVHDEVVIEMPKTGLSNKKELEIICGIMGEPIPWAEGLPNGADGYLTDYYKKED